MAAVYRESDPEPRWEFYRHEIEALYLKEDLGLENVMDIMAKRHNFHATSGSVKPHSSQVAYILIVRVNTKDISRNGTSKNTSKILKLTGFLSHEIWLSESEVVETARSSSTGRLYPKRRLGKKCRGTVSRGISKQVRIHM
jgi:hypothetical protein